MGNLTGEQKKVVFASFSGWALDAFDFFILAFVLKDVAASFGVEYSTAAWALTVTLATRFIGAFLFGMLGDKYGRKPILMFDILCYSVFGAATAFAPNLAIFLILRGLFGVAMGGEWGLGSSLAMESIPPQARGFVSGILQCGYPAGFLLASLVYKIFYNHTFFGYMVDWRVMFLFSALPALLVLFIRRGVDESPAFLEGAKVAKPPFLETVAAHWQLIVYASVLMMAFNMFSHGSQDLYPTFLQVGLKLEQQTVSNLAIVANLGAIAGGLVFGALSERIGRVNAITLAALIALPAIPLWAYGSTPMLLGIGAFIMQISVQGAWGIIPAHLNELSPGPVRATLPGLIYQIGNFLASANAVLQTKIAAATSFSYALALVIGVVAIVIAILIRFSPEKRGEVITVTA